MVKLLETIFFCTLVFFLAAGNCRADVEFDRVDGADLLMGIGGRAVGLGGAFVSIADDASAIFWNPSGLTQLAGNQLSYSTYIPSGISAAAFVYQPNWAPLKKHRFTAALGWVNRLNFKGDSGSGTWEGYPGHLLDLAMIDVGDDFSGRVDSSTHDLRLSLSMVPGRFHDFSFGVNLVHIS